jgi:hypothetical protein
MRHFFGAYKNHPVATAAATAAQAWAKANPTARDDSYEDVSPELEPHVDRLAKMVHKSVVRRGLKAGLFTRDGKRLVTGPNNKAYRAGAITNQIDVHDAHDHGTLGAPVGLVGEYATEHLERMAGCPELMHSAHMPKLKRDLRISLRQFGLHTTGSTSRMRSQRPKRESVADDLIAQQLRGGAA